MKKQTKTKKRKRIYRVAPNHMGNCSFNLLYSPFHSGSFSTGHGQYFYPCRETFQTTIFPQNSGFDVTPITIYFSFSYQTSTNRIAWFMHLVEEKLQIPIPQRSKFFDCKVDKSSGCRVTKIEVSSWWLTWFRFSLFTLLLRIATKYKKDHSSKKTMMECVGKKVAIRLFLNGYINVNLDNDCRSNRPGKEGWIWLFGRKSRKHCLQYLSKPEPVKVAARKKKAMKALSTNRNPKIKLVDLHSTNFA